MSDDLDERERSHILVLKDEAIYILVLLALRLHDAENGTELAKDPGFRSRIALWEIDGIPWDIDNEEHRDEMLQLLLGNALTNARKVA
jgi:hypothetical protein